MGEKRNRRAYSAEFKRDAVALVTSSGRPVQRVAQELGVHGTSLGKWVHQARIDNGEAEGLSTEDKARIRELERENRILKMEREILKRAEAFWVRESNR